MIVAAYGMSEGSLPADHLSRIAVASHLARRLHVNPLRIQIADDLGSAWVADEPGDVHRVSVTEHAGRYTVVDV